MKAAIPIKSTAAAALSLLCLAAVAATVAHRPAVHAVPLAQAEAVPAPIPEMQVVTVTARRPIQTIVITAKRPAAGDAHAE